MPTSAKDIEKLQDRAQSLRDQLAAARDARTTRESEAVNDVTKAQLDAEIAQLQVDLDREKEAAKVSNVKAGLAAPLGDAQAAMDAAAAQAAADADAKATPAKEKE